MLQRPSIVIGRLVCASFVMAACGRPHDVLPDADGDDAPTDDAAAADSGTGDSGTGDSNTGDSGTGGDAAIDGGSQNPCDAPGVVCSHLGAGTEAGGLAVAVDAQRNVYVAGYAVSDLVFGTTTLFRIGQRDAFVVSFTADGALRWARRFGAPTKLAGAYGVAIDANANVYIAGGGILDGIDFGGGPVAVGSGQFVASYDTNGGFRWARADAGINGAFHVATAGTRVYTIGRFAG